MSRPFLHARYTGAKRESSAVVCCRPVFSRGARLFHKIISRSRSTEYYDLKFDIVLFQFLNFNAIQQKWDFSKIHNTLLTSVARGSVTFQVTIFFEQTTLFFDFGLKLQASRPIEEHISFFSNQFVNKSPSTGKLNANSFFAIMFLGRLVQYF